MVTVASYTSDYTSNIRINHIGSKVNSSIKINNNTEIESKLEGRKIEKLIKSQLLRFARRRRLLCKNGMYLAIDKNGVHGTKDRNNPYADLHVLSIGSDMFAIWGTKAGLYVAVNPDNGQIYTTAEEGRHCVFIETLTPDFHNIYESYKSVFDGQAQYMALTSQNKLAMKEHQTANPERNGQFIWEIVDK